MSYAISRQENMTYSSLRRADTWSPSITHKEGTHGRSTLTSQPKFLGWIVYQIILAMGLLSRARFRVCEDLRYHTNYKNFQFFSFVCRLWRSMFVPEKIFRRSIWEREPISAEAMTLFHNDSGVGQRSNFSWSQLTKFGSSHEKFDVWPTPESLWNSVIASAEMGSLSQLSTAISHLRQRVY